MDTSEIAQTLATLLGELVHGPGGEAYMLNPGDEGLFRSLEKISAADASAETPTGSSIAAHVDHVRYGLSLMNRWSGGENPFDRADWSASWRKTSVSEHGWRQLQSDFREEATRWLSVVGQGREVDGTELNAMVGSVAHLAYHLGAIRQINQNTRGPRQAGT